ncbi:SDR family oxidoreductase [Flavobacterium sp. SUN046]|jgi:NAD(P)-dependent dehydrogenase (short-subunit alcohol dehydrogenase family)|uniref:SDR family oxidoreductase n=1 Tax=Flavobacterium sp. SUN046 TaxID=3002440 RepID=UPI002DBB8E9C|nr:SDR family oxidoreductase [Flavobacterium sp. SUN046]MEC4047877.1 SDR family oxidoreductase [Flavobacterium sp. SUN046]
MNRKIALVTGGSRGLGKNMALRLAEKGHDVIITYHTKKEEAQEVVTAIEQLGMKATALQLDVNQTGSLDGFIQEVTKVLNEKWNVSTFDFLINNAGIGATIPYLEATEEDFDRMLNIHFKSVYFLTQKALAIMNNNGRIINLSSGTTRFCNPGYSIYASMKGAIETFTRYLAKEVGARGITANVIAPGPIETDFNNATIRNNPQIKGYLANITALGRVGEASDIGGIVAFLCSEDGYWINGQRIEASGGISL